MRVKMGVGTDQFHLAKLSMFFPILFSEGQIYCGGICNGWTTANLTSYIQHQNKKHDLVVSRIILISGKINMT